jgi:hypothetical protein
MAINIKGMSGAIRSTMEAAMKGENKYYYDTGSGADAASQTNDPGKRMKVDVSYGKGPEGDAHIRVFDRKTGQQEEFFFKYALMLPQLIKAVESRDASAVRVLKAMKNFEDLPGLWKEEWKNKRCMYLGTPNAAAMSLLNGLRRPVSMGWIAQKDGSAFRGGVVSRMFKADLMRAQHSNNGKVGYFTNRNGYEVLRHWADKNKLFASYLEVFMPKDWEENELAREAFNAMHGRFPVLKGANAPLKQAVYATGNKYGHVTPVMRKLGIKP